MRFRGLVALALSAGVVVATGGDANQAGASVSGPSADAETIPRRVDREAMMTLVTRLAAPELHGRLAGSPGGLRARAMVARAFAEAGLRPAGTRGFLQPFRFSRADVTAPAATSTREMPPTFDAANVVGRLEGRDRALPAFVLSAHYDHLPSTPDSVYPGADDNASGTALLVEVARVLSARLPRHPMVFAAFDAEELGLLGATQFVEDPRVMPSAVALNVNLDMVSRSDRRELYVAGTSYHPSLRPPLEAVARRAPVQLLFGHDGDDGSHEDWTNESDHAVFHQRGIPFVYFGVEDHEDYHRPTDTADRIEPEFFGDVADTIVEAILTLDEEVD
jgi:hypothetical protein